MSTRLYSFITQNRHAHYSIAPHHSSSTAAAAGLALCPRGILATRTHRWVPVDTHSTPVPVSTGRLWVAHIQYEISTTRSRSPSTRRGSARTSAARASTRPPGQDHRPSGQRRTPARPFHERDSAHLCFPKISIISNMFTVCPNLQHS